MRFRGHLMRFRRTAFISTGLGPTYNVELLTTSQLDKWPLVSMPDIESVWRAESRSSCRCAICMHWQSAAVATVVTSLTHLTLVQAYAPYSAHGFPRTLCLQCKRYYAIGCAWWSRHKNSPLRSSQLRCWRTLHVELSSSIATQLPPSILVPSRSENWTVHQSVSSARSWLFVAVRAGEHN